MCAASDAYWEVHTGGRATGTFWSTEDVELYKQTFRDRKSAHAVRRASRGAETCADSPLRPAKTTARRPRSTSSTTGSPARTRKSSPYPPCTFSGAARA